MNDRERLRLRQQHYRRAGRIVGEVWERSGIGPKEYPEWHVVNRAIEEAVKVTFVKDISDASWIDAAVEVYRMSWPQTAIEIAWEEK